MLICSVVRAHVFLVGRFFVLVLEKDGPPRLSYNLACVMARVRPHNTFDPTLRSVI